jgi:predicted permease
MLRLETLRQDALYAGRTLRNSPAFAMTAIFIIAVAIGGNTAMFTVIRAVLLKPLAYRDPDRLVGISGGATPSRLNELKAASHSYTGIAAYTGQENLTLGGSDPEVLRGVRVSAGFLQVLGVDPTRGRSFLPQEDSPGAAAVAMISHELWQRRFAGDSQIIGNTVSLSGSPCTIIGVLPPHFQFPSSGIDLWLTDPAEWPPMPPISRPISPFLTIFGRLKPGVSLDQASAEAVVVHHQYAIAHPAMIDAKLKSPLRITPMKEDLVANVRSILWMLFAAVGFVLLIACANVASLLLARAAARSREFAVRAALGATRTRIVSQLLVESVFLSCCGGVLGVLLSVWSLRGIASMTALNLPRTQEIGFDWVVFGFAAGLSVFTGLFFGLAPCLGATRPDLIAVLRTSGQAASGAAPKRAYFGLTVRGSLVAAQVALSIVLLIGAALLVKSVSNLRGLDTGFNPSNLLTMRISLAPSHYDTSQKRWAFYDELNRRVAASPGIRAVGLSWTLPMTGSAGTPVQDASQPPLRLNERPIETVEIVAPGYLAALQMPLRRGRDFTARDLADAQRVAIIDEGLARQFWPAYPAGPDPVGKRLMIGGVTPRAAEIVGIVADVRLNLEKNAWPGTVYLAMAQNPPPSVMIAARTPGNPRASISAIRQTVLSIDRDQPVSDIQTMDELVEAEIGQRRLVVAVLGSFAVVALLLALTGIYGVISYTVTQRVHELGIRRALGAQTSHVIGLVMGQGLTLTLAGIVIGIAGALALTGVMKSLLFHVSATDPASFAAIALLFLLVASAASYIPARRAARLDPMAALREE